MPLGAESVKDFVEMLSIAVGAGALVLTATMYALSRKQLNFEVMVSCITRYQNLALALSADDPADDVVSRYIDLCNEQLFYFQHDYLPDPVVSEWIEGMTRHIEHVSDSSEDRDERGTVVSARDLEGYPRVEHAFTVDRIYDTHDPDERQLLVQAIKANLGAYQY